MRSDAHHFCRVCGYQAEDAPWGWDGMTPSFEICPSCGVEYGYEDATLVSVRRYREQWLAAGGRWSDHTVSEDGLGALERLQRVPEAYR